MAYPEKDGSSQYDSDNVNHKGKAVSTLPPRRSYFGDKTPYLGLQARLSQVWFNRWTVLLILVLVRVLILLASLNDNLDDAEDKALSACRKVEDVGSAMASMPHYLSVGVNALTATGVTKAVHAMMATVDMILTAVKELILFVINMMTSTYTCLIALVVHGALDVASTVVEKATDQINNGIHGVADDIGKISDGVQKSINDAWDKIGDAINGASNFFGGGNVVPDKPNFDIGDDLKKLKDFKIDGSKAVNFLDDLNKDLPTFDEVQNFTRNTISIPFDLAQKALNDSYGGWKFDDSVFPVAKKEALSFCSNNSVIEQFFDKLFKIAHDAKIAFIVGLSLLAIGACAPMAWWEIRKWKSQQAYRQLFEKEKHDTMDLMMMNSRPWTSKMGVKMSGWFFKDKYERKILFRWCVAYGTSLPALFLLSLAIAGFFSCLCQYIILKSIEKEVPGLADQVGDFAGEVVGTLQHVSADWANDANGVIVGFNDDVNKDVLGYVTNATQAVNDTLDTFVEYMDKGLTAAFKDTVLMDPVKEVVRCLIGLKVESVQKGLTWVHDHAKIDFPLFPNDTFSAGAQKSVGDDSDLTSFLASPSSVTTDEVTGAVTHVTTALRNGIIQEALISTGILLVYILVVMIGIIRMLVGLPMAKGTMAPQATIYEMSKEPSYAEPNNNSRGRQGDTYELRQ